MQVRSPCRAGGPKPARGPRRHHPTDLPSGEPEHHLPLPLSSTPPSPTSPPLPRPPSRSHNVTSPGCSRPHPPTTHRPLPRNRPPPSRYRARRRRGSRRRTTCCRARPAASSCRCARPSPARRETSTAGAECRLHAFACLKAPPPSGPYTLTPSTQPTPTCPHPLLFKSEPPLWEGVLDPPPPPSQPDVCVA